MTLTVLITNREAEESEKGPAMWDKLETMFLTEEK